MHRYIFIYIWSIESQSVDTYLLSSLECWLSSVNAFVAGEQCIISIQSMFIHDHQLESTETVDSKEQDSLCQKDYCELDEQLSRSPFTASSRWWIDFLFPPITVSCSLECKPKNVNEPMYGIELYSIEFFMSLGSQQYVTFTLFIDTCTERERKGESVMEKVLEPRPSRIERSL